MKHLLPVFLLIVSSLAVLWAQSGVDGTVHFRMNTLIVQGKFLEASSVILKEPEKSLQHQNWAKLSESILILADSLYEHDSFALAIKVLDHTLNCLRFANRSDSISTAAIWTWKAYFHRNLEQYSDVLDAYETAIRIFETNKDYQNVQLAYCYNHVAQTYTRRHDYQKADKSLKASIESDVSLKYLLSNYSQLASNAYWWDSLDLGVTYFKTGMRFFEKNKKVEFDGSALAALRSAGADILIKKGNLGEAATLTHQAMAYYRQYPDEADNLMRSHTTLAKIFEESDRLHSDSRFVKTVNMSTPKAGNQVVYF